jgi:hypothetical protein
MTVMLSLKVKGDVHEVITFIQRIKGTYSELTRTQEMPASRLLYPSKENIKKIVCEVYD